MELFELKNKSVLITGSSRGIGKSIAWQCAKAGAKVIISSRKYDVCEATAKEINDDIGDKKDLEKIILCDVQIEIYPELEKSLLNLLHNSGYPGIKFEKKIDFEQLYNQRLN